MAVLVVMVLATLVATPTLQADPEDVASSGRDEPGFTSAADAAGLSS